MIKLLVFVLAAILLTSSNLPAIEQASAKQQGQDNDAKEAKPKDSDHNKIYDELEKEIQTKSDDYKTDVIVMLNLPNKQVVDKIKELKGSLGEFTVSKSFSIVPGFAGELTKQQILKMAKQPFIAQIEPDAKVQALLGTATTWFGVQKARADFSVDGDMDGSPSYSKDDIVIAVIDTGIDTNHIDLDGGKVIGWKDFINSQATPYDDNKHGTWVSSIAAGTGEGNPTYTGVAPRAALVGVKVLNSAGSGSTSTVMSGLDWVVNNKNVYGIEIVNLSLGASECSDGTDSLSVTVNNAVDNGLIVVVAAGNSGPKKCTISSPAAAEKAITVGAIADVGEKGFYLASFSSRGPTLDNRIKPDVAASGVSLTAAQRGTTAGYVTLSGTSGASPFVAGTVALMLDKNSSLSPIDIKNKLMSSAIDWGPSNKDIDYGSGRLDAYESVRSSVSPPLTGTNIAVPTHTFISDSLPGTGSFDNWSISVIDSTYPIAVVMIMPTWTSSFKGVDLDMRLFNPSGTQIATSLGVSRQETIAVSPTSTGTYRLKVESFRGSGPYFLDISSGSNPPGPTVPSAPQNLVANAGNAQVVLSWSAPASDGGSAITNYKIYRGTSSGTLASKTLIATLGNVLTYTDTTVTNGTPYYYQVTALNSVGESSGSNEVSATPTEPDNTAPSITGATGDTASTTGEAKTVSATVTDNVGVSGAVVHYTPIDGIETAISMTQGPSNLWSADVPVAAAKVGTITYFITATDAAANSVRDPAIGTYTITVTDNDAPAVTLTSPANGAIVKGTITLSANANDNIGVAGVEFFDGLNSIGVDTTAPYSISWSTGSTSDGAHSIKGRATDAAGNFVSHTINVTVDNTPPTAPTNLVVTTVSSTRIDLSWSASTDNVGVTGYKVYRNGIYIATVATTSYSSTGLNPGTNYSYEVSAIDGAGNESVKSGLAAATTLAQSLTITSHTESVKAYSSFERTLTLLSVANAKVSGTPSNVQYKYTFSSPLAFNRLSEAYLFINGAKFELGSLASVAGSTITFNLAGFSFNDGNSVKVEITTKYSNASPGSYALTAEFNPGTSDMKMITL